MMDLTTIIKEWKQDALVDVSEPGSELLKVPNLHAKYCEQHALHSRELRLNRNALACIRRDMTAYYQGRSTPAECAKYGLAPFLYVIAPKDLPVYLEADPRVQKVMEEVGKHEDALSFLDKVVKEINNRSFELRGYLDYLKWSSGG